MDIDKALDTVIDADIDGWRERKHFAAFSPEGEADGVIVGSFYVDGRPLRTRISGESAWVTLSEAKHIADRLGVPLQGEPIIETQPPIRKVA